jgi:hypothetical protein
MTVHDKVLPTFVILETAMQTFPLFSLSFETPVPEMSKSIPLRDQRSSPPGTEIFQAFSQNLDRFPCVLLWTVMMLLRGLNLILLFPDPMAIDPLREI